MAAEAAARTAGPRWRTGSSWISGSARRTACLVQDGSGDQGISGSADQRERDLTDRQGAGLLGDMRPTIGPLLVFAISAALSVMACNKPAAPAPTSATASEPAKPAAATVPAASPAVAEPASPAVAGAGKRYGAGHAAVTGTKGNGGLNSAISSVSRGVTGDLWIRTSYYRFWLGT